MTAGTCDILERRGDPKSTVDEVMRRWPVTVAVFIRHRMKCVGCPFGAFHTIEHACLEHGADAPSFLEAVERAVGDSEG